MNFGVRVCCSLGSEDLLMDGWGWGVSEFVDVVWRVVQVYGIPLVFIGIVL
jgi:hypothetical protein